MELAILIVAIVGLFITAGALVTTICHFKKQLQLSFFADYTKRYQEIMLNFPETINEDSFDFDKLDKDTRDKTLRYMRAYFDLCSEEYYLWNKKNIDDITWNEWKSGIKYAFSKSAFKKGWEIIALDTIYYTDFADLVNSIIKDNK